MSNSPNPVDVHVGARLRLRRMLIGMSQEKLGASLGLTFQQIQKYEKGANRIGASRLYAIAEVLGVDVQFFFEDMPDDINGRAVRLHTDSDPRLKVMDFVNSAEGLALNAAFASIEDAATRRRLVDLVKTLAAESLGAPVRPHAAVNGN